MSYIRIFNIGIFAFILISIFVLLTSIGVDSYKKVSVGYDILPPTSGYDPIWQWFRVNNCFISGCPNHEKWTVFIYLYRGYGLFSGWIPFSKWLKVASLITMVLNCGVLILMKLYVDGFKQLTRDILLKDELYG